MRRFARRVPAWLMPTPGAQFGFPLIWFVMIVVVGRDSGISLMELAPWLAVSGVLTVLGAVRFRRHLLSRRRFPVGHCPSCGYDLRASPDRCPECGIAPSKLGRGG
jgi:hypothetical protein